MSGEERQSLERVIRVLWAYHSNWGGTEILLLTPILVGGGGMLQVLGFSVVFVFVFVLSLWDKGDKCHNSEKSKGRCLCTASHLAWWRGQGWWPSIPEVIATGDAWMFYGQHGHHPREREGRWVVFHPNQKGYLDGWGIISRKFGCPEVEGCVLRWPWV